MSMTERTYNYRFTADAAPFTAGTVASPGQIEAGGLAVKDLWAAGAVVVTGEAPTTPEEEGAADAAGHQPE